MSIKIDEEEIPHFIFIHMMDLNLELYEYIDWNEDLNILSDLDINDLIDEELWHSD